MKTVLTRAERAGNLSPQEMFGVCHTKSKKFLLGRRVQGADNTFMSVRNFARKCGAVPRGKRGLLSLRTTVAIYTRRRRVKSSIS